MTVPQTKNTRPFQPPRFTTIEKSENRTEVRRRARAVARANRDLDPLTVLAATARLHRQDTALSDSRIVAETREMMKAAETWKQIVAEIEGRFDDTLPPGLEAIVAFAVPVRVSPEGIDLEGPGGTSVSRIRYGRLLVEAARKCGVQGVSLNGWECVA